MIAKITRGERAGDLAAYLHGPGNAEEHVYDGWAGGAVIGGNLCLEGSRDGTTWASILSEAASTRPDIKRPIWHASLRCAPGDRTLSDAEWAEAGALFAEAMGFVDAVDADIAWEQRATQPWVIVRHGDDHVHLAVSRVGFDGRVWHARQDYRSAQAACTQLEREYGLTLAPRVSTRDTQRAADHQLSAGEWRRAQRTGAAPERVQLAERVRAAVEAAAGAGREGFEAALERAGVGYRANVAATGRVSGYSFCLPGHLDPAGEAVWFRASQLDRALSWSKVAPVLEASVAVPGVQVPRRALESKARHERRTGQAHAEAAAQQSAQRLQALPQVVAARLGADDAWWQQRQRGGQQAAAAVARRAREEAHLHNIRRLRQVAFGPTPDQPQLPGPADRSAAGRSGAGRGGAGRSALGLEGVLRGRAKSDAEKTAEATARVVRAAARAIEAAQDAKAAETARARVNRTLSDISRITGRGDRLER
ncbi:relaxase/mobilization nuclease domain-containing protein [Kineococcus sp. SYSU DK004]|uniref:relaxase/mobilization nuclease domain-containing protein n=1 Tax=Kineococcus sp. SYSU DK004 TaxID=3383125 RepID=UPI003D7CA6E8